MSSTQRPQDWYITSGSAVLELLVDIVCPLHRRGICERTPPLDSKCREHSSCIQVHSISLPQPVKEQYANNTLVKGRACALMWGACC